jgi:ribosomal protein S18 acetylase RimI-like enzyme
LQFRLARPDDVPALRALVEAAYRGNSARRGWTHEADLLEGDRTSDAELAAAIADPARRVLLATRDGALLGSVTVTDVGNGVAYMGMLCVDPELQSAGLGRTLMAQVESLAVREFAARAMEMTVVDARTELIAYYERRGYRQTGERRPFPLPLPVPFGMAVLRKDIG